MVFINSQSYTLPTVVSVLLHGAVLYFVVVGWQATSEERKISTPKYIPAKLVQLEKTAPKAAPKPQPRTIDRAAEQREKQRQAREAEAKRQADVAKQEQAKKQQAEKERIQKEQAEQQRLQAEREKQQQQKAREQELADEEALLASEQDAEMVNSFSDVIYSKVYRNWSYPPSTRRGMHCELSVTLVPTGRVVGVTLKKSSGNPAFDRSAEQAVWKAEQFPELQELPARVFEENFRNIIITFEPQDTRL
jgi:colicin import membrane protein